MKKLLIQKFFWMGLALVVAAIVVSTVNGAMHPSTAVVDKVASALSSGNGKKLQSTLSPSEKAELKKLAAEEGISLNWDNILEMFVGSDMENAVFLEGEKQYDRDGNLDGIEVITVLKNADGTMKSMNASEVPVVEENGKIYFHLGLF